MQLAIHPWITASVVLAATGVVAVTPVVAPDTQHRAVELTSTAGLQEILAGIIDPSLAGAAAQAADAAAGADLTGSDGADAAVSAFTAEAALLTGTLTQAQADIQADNIAAAAFAEDFPGANYADQTWIDVQILHLDANEAATALSAYAVDPIQVFEADLQTDWSDLVSGQVFSSTTLADLTATLDAGPAAAQEFIAELIDPAAAGEMTAYDDFNMAADLAGTAAQQYSAAFSAIMQAAANNASDATIVSATDAAISDVSAGSTAEGESAADITAAANALSSADPTATLADISADLTALEATASTDLTALESTASADLTALESMVSADPGALLSTVLTDLDALGSTAITDLDALWSTALTDLGL